MRAVGVRARAPRARSAPRGTRAAARRRRRSGRRRRRARRRRSRATRARMRSASANSSSSPPPRGGASSAHEKRPGAGGQAGGRLVAQRARQRVLGRGLAAVRGGASTSAAARSRSPNGSSRRARSAPSRSPETIAVSTSPASRRSVSSATRRRSSSSATIVTAWCSVRRSNSVSAPPSLAATSHACGAGPSPARCPPAAPAASAAPAARARGRPARRRARSRGGRRPRRARAAPRPARRPRRRAAARRRRARASTSPRASKMIAGPPISDGQRARHAVEAALGQHDPLEPLVRRERALEHRVVLVDQVRERLLGDGDERHLVGHLEQREAELVGGLDASPRARRRGRSRCRARGRTARGRRAGRRTRAGSRDARAGGRWSAAARRPTATASGRRSRRCGPSGRRCRRPPHRRRAGRRGRGGDHAGPASLLQIVDRHTPIRTSYWTAVNRRNGARRTSVRRRDARLRPPGRRSAAAAACTASGSCKEMWRPLIPRLAREREVVAVDLPGFGASPPGPRTVEGLAEALARRSSPASGSSVRTWPATRSAAGWRWRMGATGTRGLGLRRLADGVRGRARRRVRARAAGLHPPRWPSGSPRWRRRSPRSAVLPHAAVLARRRPAVADPAEDAAHWTARVRAGAGVLGRCWRRSTSWRAPVAGVPDHDRVGRARPAADLLAPGAAGAAARCRGPRHVVLRGCGHVPTWDDPEQVASVLLSASRPAEARRRSAPGARHRRLAAISASSSSTCSACEIRCRRPRGRRAPASAARRASSRRRPGARRRGRSGPSSRRRSSRSVSAASSTRSSAVRPARSRFARAGRGALRVELDRDDRAPDRLGGVGQPQRRVADRRPDLQHRARSSPDEQGEQLRRLGLEDAVAVEPVRLGGVVLARRRVDLGGQLPARGVHRR